MAMLSFAFDYALGNSTFGFKLTNLCIHLLNTVLVLLLTQRLLCASWHPREKEGRERHSQLIGYWALGVATAWAIHPLQVSTVMYVVQRMEMLGFTFVLLSVLAYWRGRKLQLAGLRAWPWFVLVGALIVAGYGFKETAVLVPGYALLLELTLLRFAAAKESATRGWKAFYLVGVGISAAVFAFYLLPHYATPELYAGRDFTAWQRELTQLRVLPMYLGWCLLPMPSHLQFYYDSYAASTTLLDPVTTLLGGVLLLGLFTVTVVARRRRPLLALGIGWFFVAHAMTSAPLPLELVFEHRNYPALLGVLLALADLAWWLWRRSNSRVIVIVASALILNLAFLTTLRAATWGSPFRLAMVLADINPDSSRAAMDLARRYMAMSGGDASSPLFSMSVQELERASRLPGDSILPEEALLEVAAEHPGMPTQPWWDNMHHKLQSRPLIPDTYAVLQKLITQVMQRRPGIDAAQLAKCYAIVTSRYPNQQRLHADYAELLGAVLHDPALASKQWRLALQQDPSVTQYSLRLTNYLVENNRGQEALAVIAQAMELQPTLRADPEMNALQARARAIQPAPTATAE